MKRAAMIGCLTLLFINDAALRGQPVPEKRPGAEYVRVEIKGTLRSGIMAIGGEHTGSQISAGGIVWEVDLSKSPELRKAAEQNDGSTVVLSGVLQQVKGVEIATRMIVRVETLQPVKSDG